jgi:hypothetical protein
MEFLFPRFKLENMVWDSVALAWHLIDGDERCPWHWHLTCTDNAYRYLLLHLIASCHCIGQAGLYRELSWRRQLTTRTRYGVLTHNTIAGLPCGRIIE